MSTLDPNRFAGLAEAALLRDDIAADEVARAALRERAKRAQTALHDANEAVRAAQEAAASAQQSVDHITQFEHVVDERLAVSRGLLHPLRRLPDELLAMIFTWRPKFYSISRPVLCLPFALAAVCRRWRRVALSTPALWATLSCSIKDFHDIEAERSYASYLRYYLVRSLNVPLSISVYYEAENCAAHGPLWLAISELYRRAQTFSFSSYHQDTIALLEIVLSYRAPHLEDLELHNTEFADNNNDTHLRLRLDTPHLKTFECEGSPLMWLGAAPYPSVRTVELNTEKFDIPHMAQLFHHFPNIDYLGANVFHELSSPSPVVIRADRLETLKIRLDYGVKDITLAQSFSFPSLQAAYVEMGDVGQLHADATSTFIRSAFATVTTLHFEDHVADGTCSGLRFCSRLEDLRLTCREFKHEVEDTITALSAPGASGAWMCPRLRTLTLSVFGTNDRLVEKVTNERLVEKVTNERLVEKVTALATARRINAPSGPPSALETLSVQFAGKSWRAHAPSLRLQDQLDAILQSV